MTPAQIAGILGIVGGLASIGVAIATNHYDSSTITAAVSGIVTSIGLVHHARPTVTKPDPDALEYE